MAGQVQEGKRRRLRFKSKEELREYEKNLYVFLIEEVGLNRDILKLHGIDPRIFHYHLRRGVPWSPKKEELIRSLIKVVEIEAPGLQSVIEELEEYLKAIRDFKK